LSRGLRRPQTEDDKGKERTPRNELFQFQTRTHPGR
jgi:hypothetical protein